MYSKLAVEFFNSIQKVSCKEYQKHLNAMMKGERFVLLYLYKNGSSSPSQISTDMGSSTANIAKILRSLEQRNFVCRTEDAKDKRKKQVTLTENGKQAICKEMEQVMKDVIRMFGNLGEEDSKEFVRIIKRIVEVTNEIEDKDK